MAKVIKHKGSPQTTRTLKGEQVYRQNKLFVQEWGVEVPCTPYDNHFIYHTNSKEQSAYMCTCGSPAVVVPPDETGKFICLFHATYGHHTTGEKRWV